MTVDARPEPETEELAIAGVHRVRHRVVDYNDSLLVEAQRDGWDGLYGGGIDHLYWIVTGRGVRRDWGRHQVTTDRYSAVYGELEVALVDGRDDSPTAGVQLVVPLRAADGDGLLIPPGVWHTFRAVSEEVVLLNAKSPSYDPGHVDKEKRPIDGSFGFRWND